MSYDFPIGPVLEKYGWTLPSERPGWVPVKCMEHEDRQASASVNFDKNAVNCHACGFKGDALKVIQIKEGCDFGQALRIAEGIVGEGNGGVSTEHRGRHALPSEQRTDRGNRKYVPPWRRSLRYSESGR